MLVVAGKAPAHDRRAQLQHVLRPVQGPGHTTTLHPRGSDVLAGAFHRLCELTFPLPGDDVVTMS